MSDKLVIDTYGRTAEAVVRELLRIAEQRGRAEEVARCLVDAKLTLRCGPQRPAPTFKLNGFDPLGPSEAGPSRIGLADTAIVVSVEPPNASIIASILAILDQRRVQVWLITHIDHLQSWRAGSEGCSPQKRRRLVVTSIDAFIGQTISEIAGFSAASQEKQWRTLFDLYNQRWIETVGTTEMLLSVN